MNDPHLDPGWVDSVEQDHLDMAPYNQDERIQVFEAMQSYGGGFVSALAWAFLRADTNNELRLRKAFPDVFMKYEEIAAIIQHEERAGYHDEFDG